MGLAVTDGDIQDAKAAEMAVVDRAQVALDEVVNRASGAFGSEIIQLSNIVGAALLGIQATESKAAADLTVALAPILAEIQKLTVLAQQIVDGGLVLRVGTK